MSPLHTVVPGGQVRSGPGPKKPVTKPGPVSAPLSQAPGPPVDLPPPPSALVNLTGSDTDVPATLPGGDNVEPDTRA